jgi:PAS domain S-box-containing protein
MIKPSYEELERRVKELEQVLQSKVHSQDFQFDTKDLIYFRGHRDWSADLFDRKIEDLTGYRLEDFLNRSIKWLDIVHEDDKGIARDAVKRALKSDRYYTAEYRIVSRQGEIKWISIRGYICCDENDDFLSVQGVLNEITPHKYSKLALDSANEIFRWLSNIVEDGIYIVSEDYRIQFMNKTLIDLVGDHVGEVCYEALFHRDSVCPWTVMGAIKQRACGFQEYQLPKTGQIFQVRSFALAMPDGSTAKMGVLKDITRTKRLQNEVKEFAVRYDALEDAADKAQLGICFLQDHDAVEAQFRYANEAFCRITGYSAEELVERSFLELLQEDTRQAALERFRSGHPGESLDKTYELEMVRKDGVSISVSLSGALSLWEGKTAIILFLQDITEKKRVQRALYQSQRLASIGRLAAEVAHEINNPLSVVLTYIRLMRKLIGRQRFSLERLDDVNRYLSTMDEEVSRSGNIVKSLLDFSRRAEIEVTENDIRAIVEKTIDLVRHRCELEEIEIITSHAPDLPPVLSDFKRLQQPILNIILNAIEAMPNGGSLRISTSVGENREFVSVDISDSGTGISKEDLEKIFEPFFSTKTGKGVGLGLSVAYSIIHQHYGDISVRSEVGKGTQFTIRLPAGDELPTSRMKLLWLKPGGGHDKKKVNPLMGGEAETE